LIVEVLFGQIDPVPLRWEVLESPIARKWAVALEKSIPHGIFEADRFYNFPGDGWDLARIATEINLCLDVITEHYPIGVRAREGMSQEDFNLLHTFFERLRGSVDSPSIEWEMSDENVRRALENYNNLIHRWEDFTRNRTSSPRFVCTFNQHHREPLADDDYQYFKTSYDYADIVLNYCQVGKPIYDVYRDGDDMIGDDAILPLSTLSADFTVRFGEVLPAQIVQLRKKFDPWLEKNREHLARLGLHPTDPKLALGHIPVARMLDPPPVDRVKSLLHGKWLVNQVRIVESKN